MSKTATVHGQLATNKPDGGRFLVRAIEETLTGFRLDVDGPSRTNWPGDGGVALDTRVRAGPASAGDHPVVGTLPPHSLENVGETELHVIMVQLKDRAAGYRK